MGKWHYVEDGNGRVLPSMPREDCNLLVNSNRGWKHLPRDDGKSRYQKQHRLEIRRLERHKAFLVWLAGFLTLPVLGLVLVLIGLLGGR
jgi:hypothetical protein